MPAKAGISQTKRSDYLAADALASALAAFFSALTAEAGAALACALATEAAGAAAEAAGAAGAAAKAPAAKRPATRVARSLFIFEFPVLVKKPAGFSHENGATHETD
jgi:hypothetical protein